MTGPGGLVVEEYANGYQWITVVTDPVPDLDAAARLAYDIARSHRPKRPSMPKARTPFRRADGSWFVCVDGVVSKHYYSVSIMEVEGTYPDGAR